MYKVKSRCSRKPINNAQHASIVDLREIESHHNWLLDHADVEAMRDARAQWLDGVIELGVTPSGDRGQAVEKVTFLSRSTGSRLIDEAILEGRAEGRANEVSGAVAVITYAATAEAGRWGLPKPRFEAVRTTFDRVGRALGARRPDDHDLERYERASERRTFDSAERWVSALERHVRALAEAGNAGLIEGACAELRLAVIKTVTLPARSLAQLEAKHRMLARHAALSEPAWLVDPMIGSTLLLEYEFMGISHLEKDRLRAILPMGTP